MSALRVALASFAALAWPALAAAQASFTAQERDVEATSLGALWLWEQGTVPPPFPGGVQPAAVFVSNHADDAQAPDFGSFSATASSVAPNPVGPVVTVSSASASQTSSLSSGAIAASGSFATAGDVGILDAPMLATLNALLQPPIPYGLGLVGAKETGQSSFSVDFQVSVPTPYHLEGSLTLDTPHNPSIPDFPFPRFGYGLISLTGPSGNVAGLEYNFCMCSQDLDAQGVLAPGSYTLTAWVSGGVNAYCIHGCLDLVTNGSFDLSLSLAAPEVPGPSRGLVALLALALAATGLVRLRFRDS